MKIEEKISKILLQIGVPFNINGSKYLADAIKIAVEDDGSIRMVTKNIYKAVAEANKTKPANVERAIRHAINVAWTKNKIIKLNYLFSIDVFSIEDKPSNSELIALIAERLKYLIDNDKNNND